MLCAVLPQEPYPNVADGLILFLFFCRSFFFIDIIFILPEIPSISVPLAPFIFSEKRAKGNQRANGTNLRTSGKCFVQKGDKWKQTLNQHLPPNPMCVLMPLTAFCYPQFKNEGKKCEN